MDDPEQHHVCSPSDRARSFSVCLIYNSRSTLACVCHGVQSKCTLQRFTRKPDKASLTGFPFKVSVDCY